MFAVLAGGDPMQIAVDQFHELIRGLRVAPPPAMEKARDLVRPAIFLHIH